MPGALAASDLRTEYAVDPLGLDEVAPRFSWQLAATARAEPERLYPSAYEIVVATDPASAQTGIAEVWGSGRVDGDRCEPVAYAGPELRAERIYHWSVRIWDAHGEPSGWSAPARFEMGPLAAADWRAATWITRDRSGDMPDDPVGDATGEHEGAGAVAPAPLLRREWELERTPSTVRRARLYAAGLGYQRIWLDGEPVGTAVLDPAPTDYDETVLYTTHDVTEAVRAGGWHTIGVALGRGRYAEPTPNVWFWDRAPWWDEPKLLLRLVVEYADGHRQEVHSGTDWRAVDGPTRFDSLYAGERHDARYRRPGWTSTAYDDRDWPAALPARPPRGTLRSQTMEPIEVTGEIAPVGITEPEPGVFVVDFGQQFAGWAVLNVQGERGTEVRLTYAEKLREDGTAHTDQVHVDGLIQSDVYVLEGDGPEQFEPSWSYKGFQYVELTGFPGRPTRESLRGRVVHSAVASTGELETDDDLVNRLHRGVRWAIVNNLHGIPTDTPVYEKNGWSGDAQLMAATMTLNFDMARFFTKWMRDWFDAQLPSGEFPPIVPTADWGYRGTDSGIIAPIPAWDIACVEIPWVLFCRYGDRRILRRCFDPARRYLDYLVEGYVEDDVVRVGLGDYLPPGAGGVPPEGPAIYETAYAVRFAERLSDIAGILEGEPETGRKYDALASRLRAGLHDTFFDAGAGVYRGESSTDYRQSANVVPLALGITPEDERDRVLENLVADIHRRDDHLDTGVIGTKLLLPLLTRAGLVDLAHRVAMRRTYPGYGFWLDQGSTALYEMWHAGSRSRNHHFYGTVDQWFYEDVVGLVATDPGSEGPRHRRIRPVPPTALGRAGGAIETPYGRLAAGWERVADGFQVEVDIPCGLSVEVCVPLGAGDTRDLRETSVDVVESDGVRPEPVAADLAGYAVFGCGPGRSRFRS